MLQVEEQQNKARAKSIPVRQLDPMKKASYISAIGDYHAAMNIALVGSQENRQHILDVYGYDHTCILVDERETPSSALSKALH